MTMTSSEAKPSAPRRSARERQPSAAALAAAKESSGSALPPAKSWAAICEEEAVALRDIKAEFNIASNDELRRRLAEYARYEQLKRTGSAQAAAGTTARPAPKPPKAWATLEDARGPGSEKGPFLTCLGPGQKDADLALPVRTFSWPARLTDRPFSLRPGLRRSPCPRSTTGWARRARG